MTYFNKALRSYDNFISCYIPKDPVNQAELEALEEVSPGQGVWVEGTTPPTYDEVVAKAAELEAADTEAIATKRSAYEKLGLTEAEIAAIL